MGDAEKKKSGYGLMKQGNTCYLNCVLQVLAKTPGFYCRLDPKKPLDSKLKKLFDDMRVKTSDAKTIISELGNDVNEKRDAAECLELILEEINPQASELFQMEMTYSVTCTNKHILTGSEEPKSYWIVRLPMRDSVEKAFEEYFETKSLNEVYCKECRTKTKAKKTCKIVKSPETLILHLQRFDYDSNSKSIVKSDLSVAVPETLTKDNKTYKLYGMVDHIGTLSDGHYTATIKPIELETWYTFDDDKVNKTKEQPFADDKTYKSKTVYLLAYTVHRSD